MMHKIGSSEALVPIIFVSEACCKEDDHSRILQSFPRFRVAATINHNTMNPRHAAGSMLLLHDSIENVRCATYCAEGIEIITLDILASSSSTRFIHVYRSPSTGDMSCLLGMLQPLLDFPQWVVLGDFNVDMLRRQESKCNQVVQFFSIHSSVPQPPIHPSTLYGTCLDHVWCSKTFPLKEKGLLWTPYSDHFISWLTAVLEAS